jgi:hypothetical protein
LFTGSEAAAAVFLSAPYEEQESEADRAIRDFLNDVQPLGPMLQQFAHRG